MASQYQGCLPLPIASLTAQHFLDLWSSAALCMLCSQNLATRTCCADEHPEIGHAFQSLEHASDKLEPQNISSDKVEPQNSSSSPQVWVQSQRCTPCQILMAWM